MTFQHHKQYPHYYAEVIKRLQKDQCIEHGTRDPTCVARARVEVPHLG
jgi:hypothetical protein